MPEDRAPIQVTVVVGDRELVAGTLWVHQRRGQSATFRYDEGYLASPVAYSLDPALPLAGGVAQTAAGREMFNAFSDTAPDRWGQNLMRRQERVNARTAMRAPRTLHQVDFLLGTHDYLRQGALRLKDLSTGSYWSPSPSGVPKLVSLPKLLRASEGLARDDVNDTDILDLVDAGSSLGGARPKAAVIAPDGRLALAKFPNRPFDEWDVPGWEGLAAELARRCGLAVAETALAKVRRRTVLLSYRFDRTATGGRTGFASALTMLDAADYERRSYLEIAEVIERTSPHARHDLAELYGRMVFSALISNTDDHLRNHGFLRASNGWLLAPAYDMNPNPNNPGHLATAIDLDNPTTDVDLVMSVAPYFRLNDRKAREVIAETEKLTSRWRSLAQQLGLPKHDVELMRDAFETEFRANARQVARLFMAR